MSDSLSFVDSIIVGDNVAVLKTFPDNCIDLTVTSPPYDNLRKYQGFTWDFEGLSAELYRVTKPGGVVVWVVGDATVKGSETGTSFRQALYFKKIGFNLHDTMIYAKNSVPCYDPRNMRYKQAFEYMFVFSKSSVATYNPLHDKQTRQTGRIVTGRTMRKPNGVFRTDQAGPNLVGEFQDRYNIWEYDIGLNVSTKDKNAFDHPAIFPEKLAEDHILSWSNPGDIVLDPFLGSGTTAKMAVLNGRHYVGIDCSSEYVEGIARPRVEAAKVKMAEEASRPQQGRLSV